SDMVARDKEKLQKYGITHIINAANIEGACREYFPESFKYKSLSLMDAGQQNILGCFFGVIEFIEDAIKSGGKVYVHCYEGVSRSSTCIIAYIMWKEHLTFEEASNDVKRRRPSSSPNAGFISQLLLWQRFLFRTRSENFSFRIGPLNDK